MNPSLKLSSQPIIPIAKLALGLSCLGRRQMNPSPKPFSQLIVPTIQPTSQRINKFSCLNRMFVIHKHMLSDQLIRRQPCRFYMLIDPNLRLPIPQSKLSSCLDRRPIDPNPKLSSQLISPIIRLT